MYYQAVSQCSKSLTSLAACLDKAEQFAAAKKFDVGVLLNGRLAPDMKPLIYQVQSACDYVKAAAAWLSGQTPPKHEDNEQTIDDLRARIRKTTDFAEGIVESQYAGACDSKVSLSWAPGKILGGEDYLLQMAIPNVYFHIAMAYAILRNGGVDVGKMDFLGSSAPARSSFKTVSHRRLTSALSWSFLSYSHQGQSTGCMAVYFA